MAATRPSPRETSMFVFPAVSQAGRLAPLLGGPGDVVTPAAPAPTHSTHARSKNAYNLTLRRGSHTLNRDLATSLAPRTPSVISFSLCYCSRIWWQCDQWVRPRVDLHVARAAPQLLVWRGRGGREGAEGGRGRRGGVAVEGGEGRHPHGEGGWQGGEGGREGLNTRHAASHTAADARTPL